MNRPKPKFNIWDEIEYKGLSYHIIAIRWMAFQKTFAYEIERDDYSDDFFVMESIIDCSYNLVINNGRK